MFSLRCGWSVTQIQGARAYQEDRFAIIDGPTLHVGSETAVVAEYDAGPCQLLVVVADGMGGMGHGDVAAEIVVRQFAQTWLSFRDAGIAPRECLEIAMHSANQRVGQAVGEEPSRAGMGSTLLAVFFDWAAKSMWWVSVGDSLLLRFRRNALSQLNEEHSARRYLEIRQASASARGGEPDLAEATMLENPAALVSAITGDPLEWIDLPDAATAIRAGDVFAIASDGLDFLSRETLSGKLAQCSTRGRCADRGEGLVKHVRSVGEDIVDALKERAHPHQDNATLALVRFVSG